MNSRFTLLIGGLVLATAQLGLSQSGGLGLPKTVEAGSAFSIPAAGSGKATLYIVGPAQVLRREVHLGEPALIAVGELRNAGHYVVVLVKESSRDSGEFDVTPANPPTTISFLAKPSRLSVNLHDGISGVAYVFDRFQNLIAAPTQVSFQLSGVAGGLQVRTASTRHGVAWIKMDSSGKQGVVQFVARTGSASGTRVIQQVPGDPCNLRMSVRPSGQRLAVQTEPIRDCSGNAVPDGTMVTFTETYQGADATVDVPVKRGIAQTELPAHSGARISVATGVVLGNEIRWGNE